MVVYSFYIFDRHSKQATLWISQGFYLTDIHAAECIYQRLWARQDDPIPSAARPLSDDSVAPPDLGPARARPARLSAKDDAKLIFGTIFSLRNMVRKLGGPDDRYVNSCLQDRIARNSRRPAEISSCGRVRENRNGQPGTRMIMRI